MHYRSHKAVEEVISPFGKIATTKLPEDVFVSYMALSNLSRRARYLCTDDGSREGEAMLTFDKHLKKALYHLNVILEWFSKEYKQDFFVQKMIVCPEMTKDMTYFAVSKMAA